MLFILAEKEEYFDNKDHGIKAFERAKGPKKLVTIPGITHYGIYGQARPQAQKLAIEWYDTHLKGQKPASPPKQSDSAKDWPMYNRDILGTRHNPGETVLERQNAAPARGEMAIPGQGLGLASGDDPCDARRRQWICLLRHRHRSGVLQVDARRQGSLVVPQPNVQGQPSFK